MRIQREAFARMAEKPLSWLQGENSFGKGTKSDERLGLLDPKRPSQGNAEKPVIIFTEFPEAGSVAPLLETATDRQAKKNALKEEEEVDDMIIRVYRADNEWS